MLPDYRRSVYNVPHTVIKSFGIQDSRAVSGIGALGGDRVLLFLVDALGMNVLPGEELKNRYVEEITSVFPSTTSAAITSVFTGLTPGEHGILEWYMYYEGCGEVIKTILFAPRDSDDRDSLAKRCDPSGLFSLPTVFQELRRHGIRSSAYIPEDYVNSLYSRYMLKGAEVHGYRRLEDIPRLVSRDGADYIYVYTDALDTVQHVHGPGSERTAETVNIILRLARDIRGAFGRGTMLVTADHGQTEMRRIRVRDFGDCPVGGSPRDVFLYCRWDEDGGIARSEIIPLLGPGNMDPRLMQRIPERILLPPDNEGLWHSRIEIRGMHGGLSEDEMRVPLIIMER